ncbi:MAG: class I SAM-dependent rRNA methyltransferase [Flavobacteriales bacterium]|nr:MAG: class I SAM-dependent rRNA methyltransferase [Flavobacteriales bacterium]
MAQARIRIDDKGDRVRNGHPWVFATQVAGQEGACSPGDVVQVTDIKGRPLGQGYINPASMIRVRMLTRLPEARVNREFIRDRIRRAWEFRQRLGFTGSCRVVFGEADFLPGLVADLFQDARTGQRVLSVQILTLGMERWREVVLEALQEQVRPDGIFLRNDVAVREKEGLALEKGPLGKAFSTDLTIAEGDGPQSVLMHVDVAGGQKTGHFLDQVGNHLAVQRIAAGREVLDCFTHTGGFALHAAKAGARSVLGLDISADAVALATRNAALNGLGNCAFQEVNVFDYLTEASRSGRQWDIIVLDPPAFAKSKGALENAYRGYKEINLRALKSIPQGGFLVTCSCSQHMTPELFRRMVAEAAHDAGRRLREVHDGGQPADHPVLWGVPETRYLKCLVLEVR